MAATFSNARAVLVYTLLRIALFLAVWLTIELVTPVSGIWAIVIAILLSGVISIVLLDRSRNRAGLVAAGFFRGINERIDASTRAEDFDDPIDEASATPVIDSVVEVTERPDQDAASNPPSTTP